MSRIEVRLSGFGGQGIVSAAYILGKAVTLYDGRYASLVPSYGPESRGGASAADIVIEDGPIDYPRLTRPDVLVALSLPAYTKYYGTLSPDGLLITESDLVSPNGSPPQCTHFAIPATRIAESLGRTIVANMVTLGFLTAVRPVATPEAVRQAIASTVPEGTTEMNLRAFELGQEYATERVSAA